MVGADQVRIRITVTVETEVGRATRTSQIIRCIQPSGKAHDREWARREAPVLVGKARETADL